MGLAHSPRIATDGLVFAMDDGNPDKSWKGAPTTNICDNNGFYANWANAGAGTWSGNDTTIPRLYPSLQNLSLLVTTTGNLHISHGRCSISSGATYTISTHIFIPSSAGTLGGTPPYIRTDPANAFRGYLLYEGSSNWNTWPRDRWIRISGTFTNSANDTALYISCYLDTAGNKIYYTGPQVENLSFMSPFTGGAGVARSTDQAFVDMTGNATASASNLTYATDGSFSFNGSSDYIRFNNSTALDTQTPTVEVWVKTNSLNQNGFWFEKGSVNTQYSLFQEGTAIRWRMNIGGVTNLSATTASFMNTTEWFQIVGTYTSGTRKLYINGVEVASDSQTGTIATNSGGMTIGEYGGGAYRYNGSINVVKVYNRALTQEEIQQNFNALRGRYGI